MARPGEADRAVERHRHRGRIGEREADLAGLGAIGLAGASCSNSMANFAFAVPSASIAAISSSLKTDAPRETCQPTISILSFERKTARAASGSTQMLYSAAGVTLPSQQGAPPITTQRPIRSASSGSRSSASAILVSGPSVTRVRPGSSCARRRIASTACSRSGLALRRGIAAIAEAVLAMKPMRVIMRARERLVRAGEDGHVGLADLGGQKRVLGRLLEADIAGDRRQAEHADVRLGERHDDRDRVVGGGVGVDEEVAHGSKFRALVQAACFRRNRPARMDRVTWASLAQ